MSRKLGSLFSDQKYCYWCASERKCASGPVWNLY